MAFVIRLSVSRRYRSWCTSGTSRVGNYDLVPLPLGPESVLLGANSEFGDLGSYVGLSQACRRMQRQLAASMIVVRNHHRGYFVDCPGPHLACSCCSGYGDDCIVRGGLCDRNFFLCVSCELRACEDCVSLARFDVDALHPSLWICRSCHSGFDTVPSFRSWLVEVVDARMLAVYLDEFDFHFWVQFVTLSGEVLRDEHQTPCSALKYSWSSSVALAWLIVDHVSGGCVRQMVFGTAVVDVINQSRLRWSDLVSRGVARSHEATSPLHVTVLFVRD